MKLSFTRTMPLSAPLEGRPGARRVKQRSPRPVATVEALHTVLGSSSAAGDYWRSSGFAHSGASLARRRRHCCRRALLAAVLSGITLLGAAIGPQRGAEAARPASAPCRWQNVPLPSSAMTGGGSSPSQSRPTVGELGRYPALVMQCSTGTGQGGRSCLARGAQIAFWLSQTPTHGSPAAPALAGRTSSIGTDTASPRCQIT